MSRFRIFVDMDGVIANWTDAAISTLGVKEDDPFVHNLLCTNDRALEVFLTDKHIWDTINARGPEWWEQLELFPWSKSLCHQLSEIGDVCLLSKPYNDISAHGKINWIKKNFGKIEHLIGPSKHFCATPTSILVDDYPKNINKFIDAGGKGVLFPNAYQLLHSTEMWDEEIQKVISMVQTITDWHESGFSHEISKQKFADYQKKAIKSLEGGDPWTMKKKTVSPSGTIWMDYRIQTPPKFPIK